MALNKRCISILSDLIEANDYIKVQELADKYKVTDRSIRYNLDKIEQFLVKNGFNYLDKQHLQGIKINKSKQLEEFVNSFMGKYTPYKYVYSKEEKISFIITKLLQENDPIKLEYFENKLCISKNTLLKDLDEIELYLKSKNLTLVRKPRVGIYIEGNENDKRKELKNILSHNISTKDIYDYIRTNKASNKLNNLQFENLFSDVDVDFIDKLIIEVESELQREFDDESYGNLITHIAIMIKRIQLNKEIYLPEMDVDSVINTKEFDVAKNKVKKIENKYKISIPHMEICYIALRFLGAKVLKDVNGYREEFKDLYQVSQDMTEQIERIYNVSFGENKEKIIEGLILHLRPTIYRIKFNLNLINPMYDEILKKYPTLFANTKKVIKHMEDYIGTTINDQEVSYIALHFGAALENAKPKKETIARVILVCGTGVGTAKMLETQLENKFNVNVINTVSSRAASTIPKSDYDYIISTIDIPEMDRNDYIKVNSILLKKDYEILKRYLQANYLKENGIDRNMKKVNELIHIVRRYCNIDDIQQLQCEFMRVLLKEDFEVFRGRIYMLSDLIREEFIKLNVECDGWKEAIKEGTDLLENQGCVESRYYDEIINNFNDIGPYMVVAPGIVLSHARPEAGVLKLSMSLVTLKNPIEFGSETNDPAKLIITLAASDNESHLKALAQLMELFMNTEDLNKIMTAKTKEQVVDILKAYSNQ